MKRLTPGNAWKPGAGWRSTPSERDSDRKPMFYFVVIGQGVNPDQRKRPAKLCRIEVPDSELRRIGYGGDKLEQGRRLFNHGLEAHYSHIHLKKCAVYDPAYKTFSKGGS